MKLFNKEGNKKVDWARRTIFSQNGVGASSKGPVPASAVAQGSAHRTRGRQEKQHSPARRTRRLQEGKQPRGQSVPHRAVHVGNLSSAASEETPVGHENASVEMPRPTVEYQVPAWTVEGGETVPVGVGTQQTSAGGGALALYVCGRVWSRNWRITFVAHL